MAITSAQGLAQALQNQRKSKQLSQQQVAELAGVKQSTISAFENAPDGSKLETLFKLLAAMNLELEVRARNAPTIKQEWDQEW